MARLKVYRTAIGFHDAYIATTSQKAALEAWGSDKNLFAFGGAEMVTDPKLTAEPLASPGKVIRRTRGSLREHLTAAAKQAAPEPKRREPAPKEAVSQKKTSAPKPKPTPKPKLKPRPSREKLDEAEAAVAAFEAEAEAEAAEFERREADLREARKAAAARRRKALDQLERRREQAKAQYGRALERWRASL